jgi:hypothetical protein
VRSRSLLGSRDGFGFGCGGRSGRNRLAGLDRCGDLDGRSRLDHCGCLDDFDGRVDDFFLCDGLLRDRLLRDGLLRGLRVVGDFFLRDGLLGDGLLRGCRLFGLRLFGLFVADQTVALGTTSNAVGLRLDDGRGVALDVDAHRQTQVDGLFVGEAELFGELVDAHVLCQVDFSLS